MTITFSGVFEEIRETRLRMEVGRGSSYIRRIMVSLRLGPYPNYSHNNINDHPNFSLPTPRTRYNLVMPINALKIRYSALEVTETPTIHKMHSKPLTNPHEWQHDRLSKQSRDGPQHLGRNFVIVG